MEGGGIKWDTFFHALLSQDQSDLQDPGSGKESTDLKVNRMVCLSLFLHYRFLWNFNEETTTISGSEGRVTPVTGHVAET